MILDAIIYFIIAIYLDLVVPQTYGSRLPWNFFLKKSYWIPYSETELKNILTRSKASQDNLKQMLQEKSDTLEFEAKESIGDLFEPYTREEDKKLRGKKCASLHSLTKEFKIKGDKAPRIAVNNLNADFFKGQVTAILGSNGAGKSTTFALLTGMMEPTSGDATIFGLSLRKDLSKLRTLTGFCPQHNQFYENLTVRQNLQLFGELKGGLRSANLVEIEKLTKDLNIHDKLDQLSKSLSGGQKRKLSIAIALIGDSRFVIFDEPTAGM